MLRGEINQPGVFPVEQALTTPQFQTTMQQRDLQISETFMTTTAVR